MKTLRFAVIIIAIFSMFPVLVNAQEDTSDQQENETISDRIDRAKQDYPIRLSDKEKNTLSRRCKSAQKNLSKIAAKLDARESILSKRFDLIETHLTAIQKRLIGQQQDTSIIDLLITNFRGLKATHDQAYESYKLSLSDSILINCEEDPQAFKAIVEDVRVKRQSFVGTIESIKNFTKEDIKNSFDAIRTRLNSREVDE